MRSSKPGQIVIGCLLTGLFAHASTTLPFGKVTSGSITAAGQTVTYTFSANEGDMINFTIVATSGSLSPELNLYGPGPQPIDSASNGYCSGATLEMNSVEIPATGTYTLNVSDCSATNTGTYDIYMQRLNAPSGAGSLSYGQTEADTISSAAQSNTFTFVANADDQIDFTITTTSGSVSPKIRVYYPQGTQLIENNDGYCSGSTLELNTLQIPATGTYTVIIGDCADTNTGSYEIYMQRTNSPSGGTNLAFGTTETGAVSLAAQSNTFTFAANAGDQIDFTLTATSGSLSPKIRIYYPNGTQLSEANNGYCSGSTLELDSLQIPAAGTYMVLIGDCADTNTGNYEIYAQRTDNASGTINLAFGQLLMGTISEAAQSNTYVFSGNANDLIDFTIVATSGSLSPKIRIYSADGFPVLEANNGYCSGAALEANSVSLPVTGSYIALIGDCADSNTGSYDIYAQRTNNAYGPPILIFGPQQTGTISSAAQSNTYIFSGYANEVIDLTMVATSGSLSPKIRIYDPNGGLLSQANNGYCSGAALEMNTVTLPEPGTYTALIGDCADTNTGNYVLYAQGTNDNFGYSPLLWGQVQAGSMGAAAASNTYTFKGTANNSISLTVVATSGSLSPKVRIYYPDGTQLLQANNGYCSGATLQVNSVVLPVSGDYTVLVGDCADTNTGNYNISSTRCTGACPTMPAVTWPTPASITFCTALSSKQLDATANVSGSFEYSPVSGTSLTLGPHNLATTFTPTNTTTYSTAQDYVQLTVTQAPSATALASSLNPSVFGQTVTFTATVSSSCGTPPGTVTFYNGSTVLATVALTSGVAKYSTAALSAGTQAIKAVYNGGTDFTISSITLNQTVDQASTSTAVASSLNPSTSGKAVTFTATVTSGGGTPTGTVTFKDGTTTLGTGTLSGGKATFTTSTLTEGTHSITAVYGGSSNFLTSTSPALSQVVN
jgi:hypothetical protein